MNKGCYLVTVMVFFLLCSMVVWAGGQQGAAEPDQAGKVVEFWQIRSPLEEIREAYDWACENFEAETGSMVKIVRIPVESLRSKLAIAVSAGEYPDLLIWNVKAGIQYSELGIVREVDDIVKKVGTENFTQDMLTMYQAPLGVQWEIPYFTRLRGYHYWKDWLAEAGFDPEPKLGSDGYHYLPAYDTYDDFFATSKKLTRDTTGDGKVDKWGWGIQYNRKGGDNQTWAGSIIYSYGGMLTDPTTGKVVFNSPETLKAVELIRKVYQEGIVPEGVTAWGSYDNNQYFENRTIGGTHNSNSIVSSLKKNNPELVPKVGVVQFPKAVGSPKCGRRAMVGAGDSISIFKTKDEESAVKFALYLLREETQAKMFEIMGVGYYAPWMLNVQKLPMFQEIGEIERIFMENTRNYVSRGWPGVDSPAIETLHNSFLIDQIMERLAIDKWSSEKTIEEAVQTIKEGLAE
jgi:multiple sugar transport system substrate-binding protein